MKTKKIIVNYKSKINPKSPLNEKNKKEKLLNPNLKSIENKNEEIITKIIFEEKKIINEIETETETNPQSNFLSHDINIKLLNDNDITNDTLLTCEINNNCIINNTIDTKNNDEFNIELEVKEKEKLETNFNINIPTDLNDIPEGRVNIEIDNSPLNSDTTIKSVGCEMIESSEISEIVTNESCNNHTIKPYNNNAVSLEDLMILENKLFRILEV